METVEYPTTFQWVGSMKCPKCTKITLAWQSSGMSQCCPHFYCDRCSNVIHRESDYAKIYEGISQVIFEEITKSLPACSCGGRFKPGTTPKCVHCGADFPHQATPMQRLNDPHTIVVDGACVFSDKQAPYRVKIVKK
jgi:hypothetical protein